MTFHVAVLGIDGSGKSTLAASLPSALAARFGVVAAGAGDEFRVSSPEEDRLGPRFHPDGLPWAARAARRFRRRAKRCADDPRWYPRYKLAQMLLQDAAAMRLAALHRVDVMVSDGNALLSATGRAGNYRRPASAGEDERRPKPAADDLLAVYRYLLDGEPIPDERRERLPDLSKGPWIRSMLRWLRLDAVWLPEIVVFLDLSPPRALERIEARGHRVDRHENQEDLAQAREMYQRTLDAFSRYRSRDSVLRIDADGLVPGEVLEQVLDTLGKAFERRPELAGASQRPLGTTSADLSAPSLIAKALNARYLFRYLVGKWREGSWREPLFLLSDGGRLLLKEGYSAGVMRAIYDADAGRASWAQRVFLDYPLHRAVSDRLRILTRHLEIEIVPRLRRGDTVSILTAPSGFAYDLFRPLQTILETDPSAAQRIRLLASDLDPHARLADELSARAKTLGIEFAFVQGDLTSGAVRERLSRWAPYDVALFVGLSSWLPKPELVGHLRWLRERMRDGAVFVSDSFTAAAYALSGKYVGYRAHYYDPPVYRTLAESVGFDGVGARQQSGRDAINHVMLFGLRSTGEERG